MFTKKDFAVGDVVKVKKSENMSCLFGNNYNTEGLYKVNVVYKDHVDLTNHNVSVFFDDVEAINLPHTEPWVEVGEQVTLKDKDSLNEFEYVIEPMLDLANKTYGVKQCDDVYYSVGKNCYEQIIFLDYGFWVWGNECFVSDKPKVIGKPKYRSYADLVKFTSESVRVIRCKNCRYWHPEIVSSISKSMCLCELNSPKFPKTDYGYFTKENGFCPNGAPDPDRDYGYGKLSQINPKYTED